MLVYIFLTDMLETGVTYTTRVSSVLWFLFMLVYGLKNCLNLLLCLLY